jgi:hypothetical protein
MTTSTVPSAYPFDLSELLPRARALAESLGDVPSRNRLMKELRVGAPKASALREALQSAEFTAVPAGDPTAPIPPEATPDPVPVVEPIELVPAVAPTPAAVVIEAPPLATGDGHPDPTITTVTPTIPPRAVRRPVAWPVLLLALPAFVAIWSGWVELGNLSGFGVVHPLPGIADNVKLNTAITLPIGVETYAAYALYVALSGRATGDARRFAKWSALASLLVGGLGQVAYHLMNAAGWTSAPWPITAVVSCIPVAVLGMGAALAHLMHKR